MNNVRNNIKKEFTIIPNALINDNSLSDRARFVFVYMASKPDDWTFYNAELSKSLKYSIETLRKYITELNRSGWIIKEQQTRKDGVFTANTYIINLKKSPYSIFSDTVKNRHSKLPMRKRTDAEKNRVGKSKTLNNNNIHKKRKSIKNNLTKGIKILK